MSNRTPWRLWALALVPVFVLTACSQRSTPVQEVIRVPYTSMTLPRLPGWIEDPNLARTNNAQGGTVLRLVQRGAVPGAPRLEINLEARQPNPTLLEPFVKRNLQEMAQLEQAGRLRILHVDQQQVQINNLPAYRVQHEFTTGQGASQVSLYQVSLFCVYNGRGVTITASGRTELFHPQAASIAHLLQGLSIGRGARTEAEAPAIDLGKIGGSRAND